jgi:predicted nucleic acid-binding protein
MAVPPEKPRVFLDANVLLASSAFARWPYEILEHATDGDFRLVLSPLVIKQARQHLQRRYPQHLGRFERFLRDTVYELVPDPTTEEIDAHRQLVRDFSDVAVAMTLPNLH